MKITIYKITITKAYLIDEQGAWLSLMPWGGDTGHYAGYDDGGKEYRLPFGYHLSHTIDGLPAIYQGKHYVDLIESNGCPALVSDSGELIILQEIAWQ